MNRKLILIQSILILSLLLTGCSTFSLRNNSVEAENIAAKSIGDIMDRGPVKGGTIKLLSTSPDTLNPLLTNNSYVKDFLGLVYEGLVRIDKKLNSYPRLSERWEVSEDGLTWTFYLRKNVTWQDSVPFSAEDVEFTCDTIIKLDKGTSYKYNLENVSAFSAVDKYTFKITLKTPNSFTPELMTFPIIPKHYFSQKDIYSNDGNMKPVGTGPYRFISYNGKDDLRLMFNDKWWDGKNQDSSLPRFPYIAEVQVQVFNSSKDAIDAFHATGTDVAFISTEDYLKYGGRQDITVKRYTGRNFEYLAFNMFKPVTSDKFVRKAIAHAINRADLINNILPGQASISDIPVMHGTWINDTNTEYYPQDKEKAKALLLENGWKQGSSGLYKYINGIYNDLKLEILVNNDDSKRVKAAEYIANQLNETGIKAQVKKVDWSTFGKLLASKTYDVALLGCHTPSIPDMSFMYASWNTTATGDRAYNVSGFSNAYVDGYLGQIMNQNDFNERKRLFGQLKNIVMDELPYIGLYFYNEAMMYNKRIKGEINPYAINKFNDITKWYLP